MDVFIQVYLTDDSGNLIPYGSAPETEPPALDLCAWPVLQNPLLPDTVDIASVLTSFSTLGSEAFFAGLPIQVVQYLASLPGQGGDANINQFIASYLTDENGQAISVSCNVGGGGVTGGGGYG